MQKGTNQNRPLELPHPPALCGDEWLEKHKHDYTYEEIEELSIEVKCEGSNITIKQQLAKKGLVKEIMRGLE